MFAFVPFAFLALPLLSAAQQGLTPTGPAPNQVFKQGDPCVATWTPDTTGKWKSTYIELMTGNNQQMTHLTTVASNIDGTDPTQTSFSFPCPAVSPNSAIYFLQFTSTGNTAWSGRFAISDLTGSTTPPPNAAQPNGAPIPWGTGKLLSTQGTPPPPTAPPGQIDGSKGDSSSGSSASASGSSSSTFIGVGPAQTPPNANGSAASTPPTAVSSTPAPALATASSSPSDSLAVFSTTLVATPTSNTTNSSSASTPAAASAGTGKSSSGVLTTSLPATRALVAATILWLATLYCQV